jgi:hypothetical protein
MWLHSFLPDGTLDRFVIRQIRYIYLHRWIKYI